MVETVFELMEYLTDRGAPYGISAGELYESIPENAREPKVAYEFMQLKDISHIEPLSKGGQPAGDNWLLEDSSVNRSRGAETMTPDEINTAQADNIIDGKKIAKAVLTGGAITTGGAIAEVALGAAEGTFAVVETVAAIPTILTIAAVAGTGVLCFLGGRAIYNAAKKAR